VGDVRIEITPRQAEISPGAPLTLFVTITNTSTVIGGYALRVLGADPGWVQLETEQVSLFPDEVRTLSAVVTAPRGIPAGMRRIAIQVRELTPPEASTVTEVDLTVPAARAVQLRIDPLAVTAGRTAAFTVIVENAGNTVVSGYLGGDDPEGKVRFGFTPESISLAPGEHALVDLRASARRRITGSPTVRMLGLYLDEPPPDPFFAEESDRPALRRDAQPLANATFLQRAVISRGPLSLLGLLAAVTVFAIVITLALSRLVGQSTADRDLALQVAAARNGTGTGGTSGLSGTVRLLTSGTPVRAVAVSVFDSSDTTTPIATTATNDKGAYSVANLAAGKYKISFRGAGFVQLWYPEAATDADATIVTLEAGQQRAGLDVTLGGVPATINGSVVGDDVSAATLYLETAGTPGAASPASDNTTPVGTTGTPPNGGAIVQTVPIGSDGRFSLVNVPSPSVYDLIVTKAGYATSTQRIDIGAGETRNGVQLTLTRGDGLIAGTVTSTAGPLGGATITATSGQSTANTVSLTVGQIGSFTLRGLPTPATFTIVVSRAGYASQTLTLTLAAAQKLTGVAVTLSASSGALNGRVTVDGKGASGVSVTVTDGKLTVQTVTESTGSGGGWHVGGLPVPGTYTITFSRSDLSSQTLSLSIDAGGSLAPGSQAVQVSADGTINVTMQSNTQDLYGFVTQPGANGCSTSTHGLAEASVTLNSGASTYSTTTAGASSQTCGEYYFGQIPPGTYTLTVDAGSGTSPSSRVITTVAGGAPQRVDLPLAAPASMTGRLVRANATDSGLCGWTVNLYLQAQYPTVITATTTTCAGSLPQDGTFLVTGIPAGTYVVEVRQTPGSTAAASKQVYVRPSTRANAGLIEANTGG
jgi:hypothetical protein